MNVILIDNVLSNPDQYIKDVLNQEFVDVSDGVNTFQNIQPKPHDDEFANVLLNTVPEGYEVNYNFVRKSPLNQHEPNFIHSDEMMGDLTAILYLSKKHPSDDGTTIHDSDGKKACVFYSRFNRMLVFESQVPHRRNLYDNFGQDDEARIIQVIFLKKQK